MNIHHWQFLNIKAGYYFTLSWNGIPKTVADIFYGRWKHDNSSITVKCEFISTFLLHPCGTSSVFSPVGLPQLHPYVSPATLFPSNRTPQHLFPSLRESCNTCFHSMGLYNICFHPHGIPAESIGSPSSPSSCSSLSPISLFLNLKSMVYKPEYGLCLKCAQLLARPKHPMHRWTWFSRYQNAFILDFIGAKDDGGGGDNWSYKTWKVPVKSLLSTTVNTLWAGFPSCYPTNSVKALKGKSYHIPWTCSLEHPWALLTLPFPIYHHYSSTLYSASHKTRHSTLAHNFPKCDWFWKFFH